MYHNIKVNVVGPMKSGKSKIVKIIEEATAGMGIEVTEQNDLAHRQDGRKEDIEIGENSTRPSCSVQRLVLPLVDASDSEENGLVTASISDIDKGVGAMTPQGLLDSVLSIARLEHPNQSLALQVSCGPLDLFGDMIPPWFGSQKRRHAHYGQSPAMPDINQSIANPDPQSQNTAPSAESQSSPKEPSESDLGE